MWAGVESRITCRFLFQFYDWFLKHIPSLVLCWIHPPSAHQKRKKKTQLLRTIYIIVYKFLPNNQVKKHFLTLKAKRFKLSHSKSCLQYADRTYKMITKALANQLKAEKSRTKGNFAEYLLFMYWPLRCAGL